MSGTVTSGAFVGRMAVGSDASRLFGQLLGESHGARRMEVHRLESPPTVGLLNSTIQRNGGELELLVNPTAASLPSARRGVDVLDAQARTTYDGYQHSKLFAASNEVGEPYGAYTNVSPNVTSDARDDVTIELLGDTARAAWNVVDAERAGMSVEFRRGAIDDARAAGLLINEPGLDIRHVSEAHVAAIRGARDSWIEVTKGIEDPAYVDALVDASRRGVRVGVATRDIADSAVAPLRRAGVPVAILPVRDRTSRINLGIADGAVAIAQTAYPAPVIQSRDSGVLLRGEAAAEIARRLDATTPGGVARLMAEHGLAPRRGISTVADSFPGQPGRVTHVA